MTDIPIIDLLRTRLAALGDGKSLNPTEIARAIAGTDEKLWRLQMHPIRAAAVTLARAGEAVILRKGKAVDPDAFKGVYRIGRSTEVGETA